MRDRCYAWLRGDNDGDWTYGTVGLILCIEPQLHSKLITFRRSVEDLDLAFRAVVGKAKEDCTIAPIPYREAVLPAKLTFGYYTSGASMRGDDVERTLTLHVRQLHPQFARLPASSTRNCGCLASCGSRMHRTTISGGKCGVSLALCQCIC